MTTTQTPAHALPVGAHLSNCSSRVQTVSTHDGVTIITFSHTWARPLTVPADRLMTHS